MILIIKKLTNGTYRAYFDNAPNLYGEGNTREDAIKDLVDKMYAILRAIGTIQEDM